MGIIDKNLHSLVVAFDRVPELNLVNLRRSLRSPVIAIISWTISDVIQGSSACARTISNMLRPEVKHAEAELI
jgi:hypothetical protein